MYLSHSLAQRRAFARLRGTHGVSRGLCVWSDDYTISYMRVQQQRGAFRLISHTAARISSLRRGLATRRYRPASLSLIQQQQHSPPRRVREIHTHIHRHRRTHLASGGGGESYYTASRVLLMLYMKDRTVASDYYTTAAALLPGYLVRVLCNVMRTGCGSPHKTGSRRKQR